MKDEFFAQAPKEYDFLKAPLKLNIIYEDENIMILDKKPGSSCTGRALSF